MSGWGQVAVTVSHTVRVRLRALLWYGVVLVEALCFRIDSFLNFTLMSFNSLQWITCLLT